MACACTAPCQLVTVAIKGDVVGGDDEAALTDRENDVVAENVGFSGSAQSPAGGNRSLRQSFSRWDR